VVVRTIMEYIEYVIALHYVMHNNNNTLKCRWVYNNNVGSHYYIPSSSPCRGGGPLRGVLRGGLIWHPLPADPLFSLLLPRARVFILEQNNDIN